MPGHVPTGPLIFLTCLVVLPLCLTAQDVEAETTPAEQEAEPADTASKSGYEKVIRMDGATSVASDLTTDDERKHPVLDWDAPHKWFGDLDDLKRSLHDHLGLAVGVDYNLLNQYSSLSTTDTHAFSGIFRVFGTWRLFGKWWEHSGNLVYRIENRHLISGVTPRDLGHDGGSFLSTATFKDFNWGVTSFYWRQMFSGGQH